MWYSDLYMFEIYGNNIIDIVIALAVFLLIIAVGIIIRRKLVRYITKKAEQTKTNLDDIAIVIIGFFGSRFYTLLGFLVSMRFFVETPDTIQVLLSKIFIIFLGAAVALAIFQVIDFLIRDYAKNLDEERKRIATALPTIGLLAKITVSFLLLTFVLSNLGINITALIAGLGIGGLAVAFAFQKILADLFSSFVIFFDRPFARGDLIETGSICGTVERVGIKTTHIRAFTGEKIIVPNEQLVSGEIKNISARVKRKVTLVIPIPYGTALKKIEKMPEMLKEVAIGQKKVVSSHARIMELNRFAILFELVYQLENATFDEHIDTQHVIYTQVIEKLHTEKITIGYS